MEKPWFRDGMSAEEAAAAELEYWRQRTGDERIAALMEMQREYWGTAAFERIERVVRVIKLSEEY
jgi:6-phosphogluconate dehydrogenase